MVLKKNIYLSNLVLDMNSFRFEIGWIMEHLMHCVYLDFISNKTKILKLLNCILAGSVHSVAEALLILLDSTSEPIIPYNFHQACLYASSYDQCIKVSNIL